MLNAGTTQNHAGTVWDSGIRLGDGVASVVLLSIVRGIIGRVVRVGACEEVVIVIPVWFEVFRHWEMQFF